MHDLRHIPIDGARHAISWRSLLALSLLVAAVGCASPPPLAELTLVTRDPAVLEVKPLRSGVQGEWCFTQNAIAVSLRAPWRARLADHGRAVSRAIEAVLGANVLTNITLSVRVEQYLLFQRICAIASGDAGRVE